MLSTDAQHIARRIVKHLWIIPVGLAALWLLGAFLTRILRAKPNAHGEFCFSTQKPARKLSTGTTTYSGLKLTRLHRKP